MARFDRVISPGGEGSITLSIRTRGRQGRLRRHARVYTNDPENQVVTLTLGARVRPLIWVSSSRIYLSGKVGEPVRHRVEIRADMDKPLELTPEAFTLSGQLAYELKEIEKGKRFEILFSSLPGSARTYRGFLKLRTNYPRKPEITIRIKGRFSGRDHGP